MTAARPAGRDPRLDAAETDVRPIVAAPRNGAPLWLIAGGFALAALLLFAVLDGHRRQLSAPATRPQASDAYGRAAAPPPGLFVPPVAAPAPPPPPPPSPKPASVPRPSAFYPPPPPPPRLYTPPVQMQLPVQPAAPAPAEPRPGGQAIVYDGSQPGEVAPPGGAAPAAVAVGGNRVRAGVMRNRSVTVPQGTLIPAVLETALDSTRPGLARALVQRDVVGFDGTKVLISRGSRLIGEYRADLAPGQNRASVMWTRLVRPDGATIALASPAADTLGRGGIKGKVNSHFFARFGAAILQSTLDLGVALAGRAGNNSGVVISNPGLGAQSLGVSSQVQPTLTVRQGTAIMVFVARDLDFAAVEGR